MSTSSILLLLTWFYFKFGIKQRKNLWNRASIQDSPLNPSFVQVLGLAGHNLITHNHLTTEWCIY
jgi:hypothetical protein